MTEIDKAIEEKEDAEVMMMRAIHEQIRSFEVRTGMTASEVRVDLAHVYGRTHVTNVSISVKEFQ